MMIGHLPISVSANRHSRVSRRFAPTIALAALLGASTVPAGASPDAVAAVSRTFYERSFVVAADARCRLFTSDLGKALAASALQARGAAARAGASEADLLQTLENARAGAASTACHDPELLVVRDRVASAFSAWTAMRQMEFPGTKGAWKADRTAFETRGWRLVQTTRTGGAAVGFGLEADNAARENLAVVVSFVGRSRPYAVRLSLRDPERAPHPWLGTEGGGLPPEAARQAFFAASQRQAEPLLLSQDHEQGEVWVFPLNAADALDDLDPREVFVVEFLFRDDSVARARFEAGDFAAGRAFTAMGPV